MVYHLESTLKETQILWKFLIPNLIQLEQTSQGIRATPLKKALFSLFFSCGEICFFHVVNGQQTAQKEAPSAIDLRSRQTIKTYGQSSSCRARPVNVDAGLEGTMWGAWSRGQEVARSVLPCAPKPEEKKVYCLPSERSRTCVVCFYTPAAKRVIIRRLVDARHISPAVVRTL